MPVQKECGQYDHFLSEGTGLENIKHYRSFTARKELIESVFSERRKFDRLLVVGAGSGIELPVLSRYAKELVVCDFFQNAIDSARNLCGSLGIKNVRFVRASAEKLPFKKGGFDALYSKDVLHHVPNHHKALREYLRVAKKVFILEGNWRHPITMFYFGPVPIEKNMKERNVPENRLAAIKNAGASQMEVRYLEAYPYLVYLPKIEGTTARTRHRAKSPFAVFRRRGHNFRFWSGVAGGKQAGSGLVFLRHGSLLEKELKAATFVKI